LSNLGRVNAEVNQAAEECKRELSGKADGRESSIEIFKDRYMPTKEACEIVLDPRYEGQCLGADINKLACESLLTKTPAVFKQCVLDSVSGKVEEVINLSMDVIDEEEELEIASSFERARLKNFFKFYKAQRAKEMQNRMQKLQAEIAQDTSAIVQDACKDALREQLLDRSSDLHGRDEYYDFVECQLPLVPVEAARNIQERFAELINKAVGEIDQMETEVSNVDRNFDYLVHKLKDMIIEEGSPVIQKRSRSMSSCVKAGSGIQKKKVHHAKSLTELCILTCAKYAEYLPDLPEGCFPDCLLQRLITVLIKQRKIDQSTLNRLANSSMISLDLSKWDQLDEETLTLVGEKCCQLRKLYLQGCHNITTASVCHVAGRCTRLEVVDLEGAAMLEDPAALSLARISSLSTVNLSGCCNLTDNSVKTLVGTGLNLTKLYLKDCTAISDTSFMDLSCCTNLRHLDLHGCAQITDMTLLQLQACVHLRYLRVSADGANRITDEGVCPMLKACTNLEELVLTNCGISDLSVRFISKYCKHIQTLDLSHCKNITNRAFMFDLPMDTNEFDGGSECFFSGWESSERNNFYNLKHINLQGCVKAGDDAVSQLSKCPRLETLDLGSCEEVTDYGILKIAESKLCTYLKRISLAKCKRLTDKSIARLATRCGMLESLNLAGCHFVTDLTVESLASGCPYLTELDLSSCEDVTDSAVQALVVGCPDLQVLSLEELSLSSKCLSALKSLNRLKSLNLAYSREVSDDCIMKLAVGCPDIESIDLSYCNNQRFTIQGLQRAILQWRNLTTLNLRGLNWLNAPFYHPNVRVLNLSWCKNLSDEVLLNGFTKCPQLVSLDLARCGNVTGGAVHRLAQHSPAIHTFNLRGCQRVCALTILFLNRAGKIVYR